MLLAIDIGNTNIVLGVWDGREWRFQWRLSTVRDRTADEYGIYLRSLLREEALHDVVQRVVIASVVPQLTTTFTTLSERYLACSPLVVSARTDLGIPVGVDVPAQVGADRLVNAAAAYHLYGDACIVVDMGTATKLDVVSRAGVLLGGIISPGLQITADALFQRAAKLSQVDLVAPPSVIGANTVHAIQSGLIFGSIGLIEGLLPRLRAEILARDPDADAIQVIATGGLIKLIASHTAVFDDVDPWLTLKGLRIIAEREQNTLR